MKTDRFLALAVVATMFAACSNENIPVDETKDTPITIASAGVAELATRVITDDNKLEGIMNEESAHMGVFVTVPVCVCVVLSVRVCVVPFSTSVVSSIIFSTIE